MSDNSTTNCEQNSLRSNVKISTFTDWGEINKKPSVEMTVEAVECFEVISQPDVHKHNTPEWMNYPSGPECRPLPSGKPVWRYCPSVHRTLILNDGDATPGIAEEWGKWSPTKRMKYNNEGTYIGKRQDKRVLHRTDNWYRCNAVTSQLDLSPEQKIRVHRILDSLELDEEGHSVEKITFILCSLVCREDGRRTYPHPANDKRDKQFADFAEHHGYTEKQVRSWIQDYGQELREWFRPKERQRPLTPPPRQLEWWSIVATS